MPESQLRKGAIELVVLGLLDSSASYGGQLLERLTTEAGVDVSSGTLYPLLARLRKTQLVKTSWEESPVGPPRKRYELTSTGTKRLNELKKEWDLLNQAIIKTTSTKDGNR
ncbi:PadR family transcriptional regulator [Arcanobacterium phocae]|uniref:PadR family transcriptional regulator n=1 Tax=Arcanobacterium phocae TaxID=131112 RepID=UPI001C0E9B3E|nr:PadR family transcriptional regulator [Arcanobacterium phocae]